MAALLIDAWTILFMFRWKRRSSSPDGRDGRPSNLQ
jgi:hypothetical protein